MADTVWPPVPTCMKNSRGMSASIFATTCILHAIMCRDVTEVKVSTIATASPLLVNMGHMLITSSRTCVACRRVKIKKYQNRYQLSNVPLTNMHVWRCRCVISGIALHAKNGTMIHVYRSNRTARLANCIKTIVSAAYSTHAPKMIHKTMRRPAKLLRVMNASFMAYRRMC